MFHKILRSGLTLALIFLHFIVVKAGTNSTRDWVFCEYLGDIYFMERHIDGPELQLFINFSDGVDSLELTLPSLNVDYQLEVRSLDCYNGLILVVLLEHYVIYSRSAEGAVIKDLVEISAPIEFASFNTDAEVILVVNDRNNHKRKEVRIGKSKSSIYNDYFFLCNIGPSVHFQLIGDTLYYLSSPDFMLMRFYDGRWRDSLDLRSYFSSDSKDFRKSIRKYRTTESKMRCTVKEYDDLSFDFLEEFYLVDGDIYIVYTEVGSSMEHVTQRCVAKLSRDGEFTSAAINSRKVDIFSTRYMDINNELMGVTKDNDLTVRRMNEILIP